MQETDKKTATPSAVAKAGGEPAQSAGEQHQYLTFTLGDDMFALGILAIREIIEYGQVTEVPMTPPFIRGVINLRGAVVPVVDLAVRFGRQSREITRRTCIVIVEVLSAKGRQEMGVVVDAVSEVLEIPEGDIEPAPEFGSRIRIDFIQGMGKVAGKFVVILDVNRVLSAEEVSIAASLGAMELPAAA
ncbi:chemotaxis protein CheW [Dechloromonas sp. XY25]|uniref:Chemotaxis protein CheW n=1 Tax=Dechloromonas hankyongensis TaxID=2908002 RepID=A0ABS9K447_9RHOO|nr:chemotaxis protein CheW [Dechloromonas hankyongensis]MCG2577954.1 chemotaxis protein CheW [Dechloromonas hankyongensis]